MTDTLNEHETERIEERLFNWGQRALMTTIAITIVILVVSRFI